MKAGLRQRMSWLHTWCGLVCAWLLCLIFLAGSISVFRAPITAWMSAEPALPEASATLSRDAVLAAASRHLAAQDPSPRFWRIELPGESGQAMRLFWRGQDGVTHDAAMDPRSGELLQGPWGRKTEGGRHFMTLHYTLYGGGFGFWLVGWLTVGMLVALISGVVVHKRIFKDFFLFRPGRGQRAWLDGHNASAVLTLPFQLMIAYTGLAVFYTSYMPAPLQTLYGENGAGRWAAELALAVTPDASEPLPARPAYVAGTPVREQLGVVLDAAERAIGSPARMVMVERPGQARERVGVYARPDPAAELRQLSGAAGRAFLDGGGGAFTAVQRAGAEPADAAHEVMERLHLARYGGWTIRWLYFLCGLAGTLMMATGAVLYTLKRRNRGESEFGVFTPVFYRLTESLNVAAIAGACLACIGYFHANRLLPAALPGRDAWEIKAFFALWLASLVHALLRPVQRAWVEQFAVSALLCLLLPLVNAVTTGQHAFAYALAGQWPSAMVEVTVVLFGAGFALLARRLRRGGWVPPKAGRIVAAPAGHRWRVAGRVVCAIVGGYGCSAVAATALAQAMARLGVVTPALGVVVGSLLSFLLYALAALWVFGARRGWLGVLVSTAVLALAVRLMGAA
ncbi:PepSY-associated TM helix domain-containing protein [Bordetella genomosp. 5]|uniref:Peptidase n=1 Tax=Bordetella genomosp. 5 TaxID=1395608 RepID=A0A261TCC2_9BORD|nr:PepSY-associated TM helix domain-containing protein [Bordetella genomosp. 5]OZI46740.1 peptidase [Bordetella genomosp. 5]